MTKNNIKLGDEVKDRVTGFRGIAIGITEWLNGCIRITIQPQKLDKGKPVETQCFDWEQLEVVQPLRIARKTAPTGGPMPSVQRGQGV